MIAWGFLWPSLSSASHHLVAWNQNSCWLPTSGMCPIESELDICADLGINQPYCVLGGHVSAESGNFFDKGRLLLWAPTNTLPVVIFNQTSFSLNWNKYALATDAWSTPLATVWLFWFHLKELLDICGRLWFVQRLIESFGGVIVDVLDMDILMHTGVIDIICAQVSDLSKVEHRIYLQNFVWSSSSLTYDGGGSSW